MVLESGVLEIEKGVSNCSCLMLDAVAVVHLRLVILTIDGSRR